MIPVVFISSTVEDLKPYRAQARDAAIRAGFYPLMQEYFVARDNPPLKECMERVAHADVVVVIVAHRHGWVPEDQPDGQTKSITRLECEKAASEGKDILAFVVDEKCDWPLDLQESYRTMAAVEQGKATSELLAEVQRNFSQLQEFKRWLGKRTHRTFCTAEGLRTELEAALGDWLKRHAEFAEPPQSPAVDDPRKYLETLHEQCAWIDIRGFQVGEEKFQRVPIEELYIPLTIAGKPAETEMLGTCKPGRGETATVQPRDRQEALAYPRLVIVGDPGSGKTTFLKRIAFALTGEALQNGIAANYSPLASNHRVHAEDQETTANGERLRAAFHQTTKHPIEAHKHDPEQHSCAEPAQQLPVLIRIAELGEHIRKCLERPGYPGPTVPHSPGWLWDFLNARNQEMNWGLSDAFFRQCLEAGQVVLLLDGLDEATSGTERQSLARLFELATQAYKGCHFVVTTRPLAYSGESTLADFEFAQIEPLRQESVEKFLEQWCRHVSGDNPSQAAYHLTKLLEALANRIEIRRMANNPVMLTALATVHWNEHHVPEGRAELYRSVLQWLAQTREQRKDREPANRCLVLLQHLALAMQEGDATAAGENHRAIEVSQRRAAEILEAHFPGTADQRLENARAFLEQEEMDSGIIVSRSNEVRFWHLTFQEYLAARAVAGLPDADQHKLLLEGRKIFRPEWREVILLLAGVLLEQGRAKVDGLISAILNLLDQPPKLSEQARCVGLIGDIVRDLHSFSYQPADARYQTALEGVLGIFQDEKIKGIELKARLAAAEALGQAGDPRIAPDKNNWVALPAGSFLMGAQKQDPAQPNYDSDAYFHESPAHVVRLATYQIGMYPVTVEEYRRFMDDNGYQNEAWWKCGGFNQRSQPDQWDTQIIHLNRPVINVTWYEAAAWCLWAGGRLPTEAEWERAARGIQGRRYPWGDEEPNPDLANYSKTNLSHVAPVGLFPLGMTPEGIRDLGGNVWEWVGDWYEDMYYGKSPSVNPAGPASGQYRVVRGGSLVDGAGFLRASFRGRCDPNSGDNRVGFRCARDMFP